MATDNGWDAQEFVRKMRSSNKLIMGIGHRVKSINNPDKRGTELFVFTNISYHY